MNVRLARSHRITRDGPASPGKLALRPAPTLREALAVAMREILGYACTVAGEARRDPIRAVHEWRKSVRRARALLRLTRDTLAGAAHAAIARTLRAAQRATSDLRDVDCLLPVLSALTHSSAAGAGMRNAPREVVALLRTLRRQLAAEQRHARRTGQAHSVLEPHIARLDVAAAQFERALPNRLDWQDLEHGLFTSFRRAYRAYLRAQKADATDDDFHDLRKAVKAVHYQAELCTSVGRGRSNRLRGRLAELAEAQGEVTDLVLLRRTVAARGPSQMLRPSAATRTLADEFLAHEIRRHRHPADRAARKLFVRKPRKLALRLLPGAPIPKDGRNYGDPASGASSAHLKRPN